MLQLDRSNHPVVLYEYDLIWIFMKMRQNLKNEGKLRKNYKPRGGVKVRSILHSLGHFNSCQIVQWDPQNVKRRTPQKKFGMGEKMHGFHGNLLYDSRDCGVGLQIQSYLGFYLS